MGGPWFTVQTTQSSWQTVDTLWVSNGREDEKARLELRVSLKPFPDAPQHSK